MYGYLIPTCFRYIQLVLGIYFNGKTAQEQIVSLLGMILPPDWVGERVTLSDLDEATQMFRELSEVYKLQALHNDMAMLDINPATMPYLALIILYTYSPCYEGNLDDYNEVLKLNQDARQMLFSFLAVSQSCEPAPVHSEQERAGKVRLYF